MNNRVWGLRRILMLAILAGLGSFLVSGEFDTQLTTPLAMADDGQEAKSAFNQSANATRRVAKIDVPRVLGSPYLSKLREALRPFFPVVRRALCFLKRHCTTDQTIYIIARRPE